MMIRNDLSVLERGERLEERKAIYEELFPETRVGQFGGWHNNKTTRLENEINSVSSFTEDTAEKTGRSRRTIEQEIQISKNISPEVKDKIRDTELADRKTDLLRLARMNPEQQEKIVEKIISGEAETINHARKILAAENVKSAESPTGKYRVIYADPPWQYGGSMNETYGTADKHYPTMSLEELCNMPVHEITEENAVLFIWVTSPLLEDAFKVINAWGFKYKASFVWDKVKHVMGHYNSVRHEFLLVCTKGSCVPENMKLFDSVYEEERTEHSKKPDFFREVIDTIYPSGSRIELFARRKVDGWDTYGNQI